MNRCIHQERTLTLPSDVPISAIKNGKFSVPTYRHFSASDPEAKRVVISNFCFPCNRFPIGWFESNSDVDPRSHVTGGKVIRPRVALDHEVT